MTKQASKIPSKKTTLLTPYFLSLMSLLEMYVRSPPLSTPIGLDPPPLVVVTVYVPDFPDMLIESPTETS
jgi:hypothetical protein